MTVRLPDGSELPWEGFDTGPHVYDGDFAEFSERLLGLTPQKVVEESARRLLPYRASGGRSGPALVLHSATRTTRGFEGDLSDLAAGRVPYDCATYLEARSVFLARPGDLVVGRTPPWREALAVHAVDGVDIGDLEHYYLSQALLVIAVRHDTEPGGTCLTRVIDWLRDRRDAVVRMYALDREMQIFLLWLIRRAGICSVRIDANNHVVSTDWNRKRHIHPVVAVAEAMPETGGEPEELLAAEQRLSEAHSRLGLTTPTLPGYTVLREGVSSEQFIDGVLRAAGLLRRRYGLERAFLKPSEAGDGARIVGNLDLRDTDRLRTAAAAAHRYGDDHLLEAAVDFLTVEAAGARHPVAPSGHIRGGDVAEGLTLQVLNGYSWEGNAYLDRSAWVACGLPRDRYDRAMEAMQNLHGAFLSERSIAEGSHGGLVTGGVDFAVGRVGGVFGDRILIAAIDFNLSSHGAEYLRAFHDLTRAQESPERYSATRVFRPARDATLAAAQATVASVTPEGAMSTVVGCVPNRWGMVATTGQDLSHAMERAQYLVDVLVGAGLTAACPA
ncbi:hypothetical protein [Streptomyces sp. NPDC005336]|uniref:hypothetical protein n=1 Tax=unclassified Streptomyces TaxID=2593676 RepID=UPI00339F080B